jgi:hypothetical protein
MIVLSLNVCGVGGASKRLALKRLFNVYSPDVIMLQETMCPGTKAIEVMSPFFFKWNFSCLDVNGFSSGLLTTWNHSINVISTSLLPTGILMKGMQRI